MFKLFYIAQVVGDVFSTMEKLSKAWETFLAPSINGVKLYNLKKN